MAERLLVSCKIVLLKNMLNLVLVLLFFPGCDRLDNKKPATQPSASIPAAAVASSKLTTAELGRYQDLVKGYSDSMFRKYRLNGCLLVAKHGEIIYEDYHGFLNPRQKKDSIAANTPFHLASVSKTFT